MVGSRAVKGKVWVSIRCAGHAVVAFTLFSGLALAQTDSKEKSSQTTAVATEGQQGIVPTFQAHADLVLIPVTVTDNVNRFVLGLQKEDFRLFEDGLEQNVTPKLCAETDLARGVSFEFRPRHFHSELF